MFFRNIQLKNPEFKIKIVIEKHIEQIKTGKEMCEIVLLPNIIFIIDKLKGRQRNIKTGPPLIKEAHFMP